MVARHRANHVRRHWDSHHHTDDNTAHPPFRLYGRRSTLALSAMSLWLPHSQIVCAANPHHLSTFPLRTLSHHVLSRSSSPVLLSTRQFSQLYTHLRLVRCESSSTALAEGLSQDPKPSPPTPIDDAPLLSRAWKKVKHEAQHYWHGSKLLVSKFVLAVENDAGFAQAYSLFCLRHHTFHGVYLATFEEERARMTTEQSKEFVEALSIMSAKSSDPKSPSGALTKRIRTMLTKVNSQLEEYDSRVISSLQIISVDAQGRISVQDLKKALAVIKHKPDDEVGQAVIQKLDVNNVRFVKIMHVLGLVREEGLGIEVDDEALRHDDRQRNGTATMPMATTMMWSHSYHHLPVTTTTTTWWHDHHQTANNTVPPPPQRRQRQHRLGGTATPIPTASQRRHRRGGTATTTPWVTTQQRGGCSGAATPTPSAMRQQ
ncbi:hypothetical protein EV363DRAFT_1417698 [Boletus edulis]|nr:hypothetical protein EV363DRAFT_1417698 [Boletus edulis]